MAAGGSCFGGTGRQREHRPGDGGRGPPRSQSPRWYQAYTATLATSAPPAGATAGSGVSPGSATARL